MGIVTKNSRTDNRHLAGFRKFQRAALKAVDAVTRSLDRDGGESEQSARAPVKVSDMKSLVSAYKDAVVGERMVLGLDGRAEVSRSGDWPDEMIVRWVDDDSRQSEGEDADV